MKKLLLILAAALALPAGAQSFATSTPAFIQSGAGAINRTLQDKARESVSVKDFNAKGDGITDDSAAIAAALATGKAVFVPYGTYKAQVSLTGGKRLYAKDYGTKITYAGTGAAVTITNGGNVLEGLTIETTSAASAGVLLSGASSNALRAVTVTGNPAVGFSLVSSSTAAQTDWNIFENCAVNTAVLPIALTASGTGAVNSNAFRGATNYRTSAASGGTVVYLNGGGNGTIGNSFYDLDVSNYGGAGSKSVVMDGPATSQTTFVGLTIDTNASNTGFVIGSGVSTTLVLGGTIQAGTPFQRNNTATAATDVFLTSSLQYFGGVYQEAYTAPTLLNGWVNYGGSEAPVKYYKDSNGVVHIKGFIKSGTTTPGTNLFILPAGYRPAETQTFAQSSAGAFGAVAVAANGAVYIVAGSATSLSINLSFRAEQ